MNTEDDEFARIAREQALNKMADNARELGLDYEPDIPFGDSNPGLQWDEVPQAFNDWWDSEYDPTGNPFEKDTPAYWAWAGWKAAKQPAHHIANGGKMIEQPAQHDIPDLIAGALGISRGTAYDMMREALAEQEQELVVFCMHWEDRWGCNHYADPKEPHPINAKPLYTSPPAQRTWVGLTDDDVRQCSRDVVAGGKENSVDRFAYAIEAKLKEKNHD